MTGGCQGDNEGTTPCVGAVSVSAQSGVPDIGKGIPQAMQKAHGFPKTGPLHYLEQSHVASKTAARLFRPMSTMQCGPKSWPPSNLKCGARWSLLWPAQIVQALQFVRRTNCARCVLQRLSASCHGLPKDLRRER